MTAPGLVKALPLSDVLVPETVPTLQAGSTVQAARESLHTPEQEPWLGQLRGVPATQVPLLQTSPTLQ